MYLQARLFKLDDEQKKRVERIGKKKGFSVKHYAEVTQVNFQGQYERTFEIATSISGFPNKEICIWEHTRNKKSVKCLGLVYL